MANDRTVLVTGGAGWIGLRTVPLLLERGYRVRILDNMVRGDRDAVARLADTGDVELVEQDVRYGGAVHQAMKGATHVMHYAAVSINKSQADPYESMAINLVGSHNVFAAAADHGVRRLVFASSASVYGEPDRLPMSEDSTLHPLTPYCISKRAGEDLLGFYQRRAGLSWIALRFFNVYGPGQRTTAYYTSVINHFVDRLRAGEPPLIDGRGEQSMDFVHVDDVARAGVLALEAERDNLALNVGTGVDTSVARLAAILIEAVGADVEPQFTGREVLVSRRAADTRLAREAIGFEAAIEVGQGMADLVRGTRRDRRRRRTTGRRRPSATERGPGRCPATDLGDAHRGRQQLLPAAGGRQRAPVRGTGEGLRRPRPRRPRADGVVRGRAAERGARRAAHRAAAGGDGPAQPAVGELRHRLHRAPGRLPVRGVAAGGVRARRAPPARAVLRPDVADRLVGPPPRRAGAAVGAHPAGEPEPRPTAGSSAASTRCWSGRRCAPTGRRWW